MICHKGSPGPRLVGFKKGGEWRMLPGIGPLDEVKSCPVAKDNCVGVGNFFLRKPPPPLFSCVPRGASRRGLTPFVAHYAFDLSLGHF